MKTFKIDKTLPGVTTVLERGQTRTAGTTARFRRVLQERTRHLDRELHIRAIRGSGQYGGIIADRVPTTPAIKTRLVLVQVRLDLAEHLWDDRNAWEPERTDLLAKVQRHADRRGLQNARPERTRRIGHLPRLGDRVKDTGLVVGRKYEYRVIGVDEAANRAEQRLNLVATGALSPTRDCASQ